MSSLPLAADVRRLPHPRLVPRTEPSDVLLRTLTQRFAEGAERHDRDASFPFDNFTELQHHGLIAAVVPVAAGGGGASLAGTRRIVSAVARGEPSTALVLTMTVQQGLATAEQLAVAALAVRRDKRRRLVHATGGRRRIP